MTALSTPQWFKSSYSGGSGTECVECAHVEGGTLVRDSKAAGGPVLTIRSRAWSALVGALGRGELCTEEPQLPLTRPRPRAGSRGQYRVL
jgi:hypothetical protein